MTATHSTESILSAQVTMREVMTLAPQTISSDQTVVAAASVMRDRRCRHLPVMRGHELVGILSERDVLLIQSLANANPTLDSVAEAMTPFVFTTTPGAKLRDVARVMAAEKYGCAVVLDGTRVVGIFTLTDAVRYIAARLP